MTKKRPSRYRPDRGENWPAIRAQVGLSLPNQDLTDPASSHFVTRVEDVGDGFHRRIWTNQGGPFTFYSLALLEFPRRPDGRLVNWERPPVPEQLAIGDTIPIPDSWIQGLDDTSWLIRKIIPSLAPGEILITVYNREYGVKTGKVWLGGPAVISCNAASTAPPRPTSKPTPAWLPGAGPYLVPGPGEFTLSLALDPDAPRTVTPAHLVMLASKRGGGRWPAILPAPNSEWSPEPGIVYRRTPPDWRPVPQPGDPVFVGRSPFLRHPQDPDWGKTTNPPAYLTDDDRRIIGNFDGLFQGFTERARKAGASS